MRMRGPTAQGHGESTELAAGSIGLWRALAMPVSTQAPLAGAALVPATMAAVTGGPGLLSFLLGIAAGGFLALIYSKLATRVVSAGGDYAFATFLVGPTFGFITGWAWLIAMLTGTGCVVSQTADYFTAAVEQNFHVSIGGAWWVLPAVVAWCIAVYMLSRRVSVSTTVLLVLELLSTALLIVSGLIVLARGGYAGHSFNVSYFSIAKGQSVGQVILGVAIAWAGFGGFQNAAYGGEETQLPRRAVPVTIWISLLWAGLIYTFGAWVSVVGFKDPAALAAAPTPLFTSVHRYGSPALGDILAFTATLSAFASIGGNATSGTRLLYAFGRDGFLGRRFIHTHATEKSPIEAIRYYLPVALLLSIGFFWTDPATAFNYVVTVDGYLITVTYALIAVGAIYYFTRQRSPGYALVAAIGGAIAGYSLYSSLSPVPAYPYNLLIYCAAFIMLCGILWVTLDSGLRKSMADGRAAIVESA